ncbi:M16 family metallopeptidase, partial [Streptomyces sp. NPDC020801]|uniref:M16 family metallopeptidase n=1 Tax=Streptomyces sp. NPDC020801 TaxID=3365093 RepID=UPI0037AF9338
LTSARSPTVTTADGPTSKHACLYIHKGIDNLLYRAHRNAHDGLGDISRLKQTTLDDCAEFFHTHYAPCNAVLTVAGGFSPRQALSLIERHFGDIPGRPAAGHPHLDEETTAADRWLRCGEPGIPAPVVAVGYRLAGPDQGLKGYLAHMLVARMLGAESLQPAPGAAMRLSASCGFLGPMDARTPDTLVLAGMLPFGVAPEQFTAPVVGPLDPGAQRAAAVERLLGLEAGGELTSAHVRLVAEVLGRSERTVWRWLAAGRTGRLGRVPAGRFTVTVEVGQLLALWGRRTLITNSNSPSSKSK